MAQAAEALCCSKKAVQEALRKHEEDLREAWREEPPKGLPKPESSVRNLSTAKRKKVST